MSLRSAVPFIVALATLVLPNPSMRALAAQAPPAEPMRPPLPPGADPLDWEAYFDRGAKLFREAPAEAGAHFYWASRLDPSRAEPYFARWANFLFRAKNEDIYAWLRNEEAILRRPDWVTADSLRRLALMRNPFVHRGLEMVAYDRLPGDFLEGRDTRAWIAYAEGKLPQAVATFTRTIESRGTKALWTRYDRALAAVAAGDMALALTDLRTLVDELRKRDEKEMAAYASKHHLLYMVGLIHNQLNARPQAREAFGEAIVEDASFAYGHAGLAALSRASRQHGQAATEYAQAVELAPGDGHLRYLYAQTLFDLQRYEAAAAELARVIALEPHWAAPHFLLGRVRERQGREAEAYPHYERYVAMASPKDPQAKNMKFRLELRAKSDTTRKP